MLLTGTAAADATVDPCACSPNKPGFHRASALTGDWGGDAQKLFDRGVKLQAVYAPEIFAAPGLDEDRVVDAGLATARARPRARRSSSQEHLGNDAHQRPGDSRPRHLRAADGRLRRIEQRRAAGCPAVRGLVSSSRLGPLSIRAGMLSADQEFILAEHARC